MRSGGCGFAAAVWGVIYGSEREAGGNTYAREWLSDLRELAMNNIQQEQQGDGGFLSEFMNSGFGRAIEMGAGFGIGDDLINKLF